MPKSNVPAEMWAALVFDTSCEHELMMVHHSCRSVMSLTHSASLGWDTTALVRNSCEHWMSGKSSIDAYNRICERWDKAHPAGGELNAQEAISRSWTRAEERLDLFIEVMEGIDYIVGYLSTDSSRGKPKTYPPLKIDLFDVLLSLRTNRTWQQSHLRIFMRPWCVHGMHPLFSPSTKSKWRS